MRSSIWACCAAGSWAIARTMLAFARGRPRLAELVRPAVPVVGNGTALLFAVFLLVGGRVRVCLVDDGLLTLDLVEVLFLGLHELFARTRRRTKELIELEMDRSRVAVLGVLDEEHHQCRRERRHRIRDELPRVREIEDRTGDQPRDDRDHNDDEDPGRTG